MGFRYLKIDIRLTGSVSLGEEEDAGEQSGGAVVCASPLSHLSGAGLRLRQILRDSAPYPTSPRGPPAPHINPQITNKIQFKPQIFTYCLHTIHITTEFCHLR